MSELKVNKISPRSGTAITLGDSGDTFTIPSGATLAIAGSVTGFTSAGIDDNATSVAITINSSEQVGIGTTSPDHLLHISASSSNAQLKLQRTGSATATYNISASSDGLAFSNQVAGSEVMRITSTGLGIGTSSPTRALTVSGSTAPVIAIVDTGTSGTPSLFFGDSSADNVGKIQYANSTNSLSFVVNSSERMNIANSGRVGINVTSPSGLLHVQSASSGASVNGSGDEIIAENSTNSGISILSGNGDFGSLIFGDDGDNNVGRIQYHHADNSMHIFTNASERMRITSAGNVGIGTSSPQETLSIENGDVQIHETGSSDPLLTLSVGNTQASPTREWGFRIDNSDSDKFQLRDFTGGSTIISADTSGNVSIGDAIATQKLDVNGHIAANGLHFVNNTTSPPSGATIHQPSSNVMAFRTDNNERMRITDGGTILVSNTSEPSGGDNGAQISNGSYHIFCRNTSGSSVFRTFGSSGEFRTLGNGNAANTNNVYGAISDRELKENEVDANSQWNDIKALQIKNYNLKSQPNQTHLGVIAQDLEASGMNGLVEQNEDEIYTGNDVLPEGKNIGDVKEKGYKTVKYSVLYMKSVKALQEAMTRIESLEAEVTALKNQP